MSVYVDPLMKWPTKIACFRAGSCHLIADTLEELHTFAARLQLKRSWFQLDKTLPHYDLTVSKRALAVLYGAIEIDRAELVRRIKSNRRTLDPRTK